MVMPGAFSENADAARPAPHPDAVPARSVGAGRRLARTARGSSRAVARGRLIPDVARARELLALLRAGAIDGLSIGYRTVARGSIRAPGAPAAAGRSVGDFDRHLPAAAGARVHRKLTVRRGAAPRWTGAILRRGRDPGDRISARVLPFAQPVASGRRPSSQRVTASACHRIRVWSTNPGEPG